MPHWQTDLRHRPSAKPADPDRATVLFAETGGVARLTAVCPVAARLGLHPGLTLADSRARIPTLDAHEADPIGAAQALDRLADWALRYTPWVAVDGHDGLWLDITGCAHLFGGEEALCRRLVKALSQLGGRHFHSRMAIADTPASAWAVARYGISGNSAPFRLVAPGATKQETSALPIAALRLDNGTVAGLDQLGLRQIGDVIDLPRAPLTRRFGPDLVRRLDQLTGRAGDSLSPRREVPPFRASHAFAEPAATIDMLTTTLDHLLNTLCQQLAKQRMGARKLDLILFRVDHGLRRLSAGTSRPVTDPKALAKLFADQFQGLEVGEGIDRKSVV